MKRFAVAYIYQEIPRYDTVRLHGDHNQYLRGDIVVAEYFPETYQLDFKLGLNVIDATDSNETIQKATLAFPYHIVQAIAMEV